MGPNVTGSQNVWKREPRSKMVCTVYCKAVRNAVFGNVALRQSVHLLKAPCITLQTWDEDVHLRHASETSEDPNATKTGRLVTIIGLCKRLLGPQTKAVVLLQSKYTDLTSSWCKCKQSVYLGILQVFWQVRILYKNPFKDTWTLEGNFKARSAAKWWLISQDLL